MAAAQPTTVAETVSMTGGGLRTPRLWRIGMPHGATQLCCTSTERHYVCALVGVVFDCVAFDYHPDQGVATASTAKTLSGAAPRIEA